MTNRLLFAILNTVNKLKGELHIIYFTSDLHFGHENIIELEKETRGHYLSANDMNEDLIWKWNQQITKNDIVYYLGDFSFNLRQQEIEAILYRLKFKQLHVILGNHDNKPFRKAAQKFDNVTTQWGERIKAEGFIFHLSHYPMILGERPKLFNLHGHIHSLESPSPNYQINVGYDYSGRIAVSMEEVLDVARASEIEKMKERRYS